MKRKLKINDDGKTEIESFTGSEKEWKKLKSFVENINKTKKNDKRFKAERDKRRCYHENSKIIKQRSERIA